MLTGKSQHQVKSPGLKLVVISPFPPSGLGLCEYTFHLVNHWLSIDPDIRIEVLADIDERSKSGMVSHPRLNINRVWKYNQFSTIFKIMKAVIKASPDVIWIDLIYTSFGSKPVPAFLGLCIPVIARFFGFRVVTTLHHLHHFVDENQTKGGVLGPIKWLGLEAGLRLILRGGKTILLLKRYQTHIEKLYGKRSLGVIPHGFYFSEEAPSKLTSDTLLIFGRFGTYKKLDMVFDIIEKLNQQNINIKVLVAGSGHPAIPEYMNNLKSSWASITGQVSILGYVDEKDIPKLFQSVRAIWLPYDSTTGVSGVGHLGASFGLPIICPDLPDLVSMDEEYGLRLCIYPTGDLNGVTDWISRLWSSDQLTAELGEHNKSAAQKLPMIEMAKRYLLEFLR